MFCIVVATLFSFLIYQRVYYIIVIVVIAFCKQMGLLFLLSLAVVAAQYTCARSIDGVCVCGISGIVLLLHSAQIRH